MQSVQVYKRRGVPGTPISREIAAGHDALRIIDGKADIIPADVGYYLPAKNWERITAPEGRPIQPWHTGVCWVPLLTGNCNVDRFTYGVPDGVGVWDGNPADAVQRSVEAKRPGTHRDTV